ncbi:MAG: glycosyltransferase family 4 protein, partial [Candidatus Peribacteria bacterium]|nr:glycosyltransferase family 4 protein [Candidatus Peribacteria bacterium]
AEGQPLTLLEAFASKLPVLVTDVGDNKYFVKEGENGWMVPAGDEEALAESIEKVLKTDPISLEEIGERNYSLVQKYSWKNIVKQTYHQYTLLITM